jgi:hypothetical protein
MDMSASNKRNKWLKSSEGHLDCDNDDDDDIVTEQASDFEPDASCSIWRDTGDGPFFRNFCVKHRQQMGPTCVSNVLAMLTNRRPEAFQRPNCDLNTQCPISWSDALLQYGKKFSYCSTDCRRLKYYLRDLIELGDLFVVCYYTDESDVYPERITVDPDDSGNIIGSHIVLLHMDKIYDSAKYHGDGIDCTQYGEKYVKRIFRVVPTDYRRGL